MTSHLDAVVIDELTALVGSRVRVIGETVIGTVQEVDKSAGMARVIYEPGFGPANGYYQGWYDFDLIEEVDQ